MKFPSLFNRLFYTCLFFISATAYGYGKGYETIYTSLSDGITDKAATTENTHLKSTATNQWMDYKNTDGAYSVKFPEKPNETIKEIPNPDFPDRPYQVKISLAGIEATKTNYLVRYVDYPVGQYLANSANAFAVVLEQFKGKGEIVGQVKKIFKDGYEGCEFDAIMEDMYFEIKIFLRGNRNYMLMRQNVADPEKPSADEFFTSFKFEPFEYSTPIEFSSGPIKVMMPGESKLQPFDGENVGPLLNVSSAYAVNKKSGGVYAFEMASLSKYLKYPDVDSLYRYLYDLLKEDGDSLLQISDVAIGSIKGKMILEKDLKGGNYKKSKMWVDADRFFYQFTIVAKEELESKQMADFFSSVIYQPSKQKFNLSSSKAQLIADDLFQKDTTVYKNALAALSFYQFDKKELPIIYKILEKPFDDDTLRSGIRQRLISKLNRLNDATTVPFLKTMYEGKNPDIVKYKVLTSIPRIDTTAYDWYFKNLVERPALEVDDYWDVFEPLSDSLVYVGKNFNQVLTLLDRSEYARYALSLIAELVNAENKERFMSLVSPYQERITKKALADVDYFVKNAKEDPGKVYSYLIILEELGMTKLLDDFSNQVFKIDSVRYLHTLSLAARIRNKLTVDPSLVSAHLDSLSSRYMVMKAYFDSGRIEEVPSKYRAHEEFSRLLAYEFVNEEYDLEKLTRLGTVNGDKGTYYIFEVITVDDEKKYLMICGAFDEKKVIFDWDHYQAYTDWAELEADWQTQAKEMIKSIEKEKQ